MRLDTESSSAPFLSLVRPGGRTSFIPSAREAGEFISRTDTLLRTQTITKPQKYLPSFYRFCTISFVSFVSFVTITFSIHLLLRYLKRPLKRPSKSPLKGDFGFPPFKGGEGRVLLRISDRKITIRDTVYICRTDTLLRTQTITQKERYIPPFYRFCTITLATLATFATLAFSIHLLLRYKRPPLSPPKKGCVSK